MMKTAYLKYGLVTVAALGSIAFIVSNAVTAPGKLDIAQAPLFTRNALPPLNMLVMGRDHKLYYEAYNDASDLDQDGVIDVGYKPDQIKAYYGYYNSNVCYESRQGTGGQLFVPVRKAGGSNGKQCGGASEWSGDFLNYLTTSRMDALRKVLYGGYRQVDSKTETILQASYTPQDAHSWGKEYQSVARDGYDITKYAPSTLGLPGTGRYHLFVVTTLSNNGVPQLRVLSNTNFRVWNWVSIERPVAGNDCFTENNNRVNCVSGSSNTGGWQIVPASDFDQLKITTWKDQIDSPADKPAMDDLFRLHSAEGDRCGTSDISQINKTGKNNNPFSGTNGCSQDKYHTLIKGKLYAPESGNYQFAVNGDDAVDVSIDGTLVASWYGGHGQNNSSSSLDSHSGSVYLSQGYHAIEFRHEEGSGDDNWQLYWKTPSAGGATAMTNYALRVQVCPAGDDKAELREDNCKSYDNNTAYKPTGILHDYGETERMYFGLLSGSYQKNMSGGVLRKNMSSFKDEIDETTGQFKTDVKGIVYTINAFRIFDFNYGSSGGDSYKCGWISNRAMTQNDNPPCYSWGNPIAEMMYETLRYFAGAANPRNEYKIESSSQDVQTLELPVPSWKSPYKSLDQGGGGYSLCAQPTMTVISDINTSYDYKMPGSHWATFSGSSDPAPVNGFNASTEADQVWSAEGGGTQRVFIGESNDVADNAPTPKDVSNLSTVRGQSPEEPSKQGTYYAASVARFGANNKINGEKYVRTYAVALSSPLPKFKFPVGNSTITLVPFAKSVSGGPNPDSNFQPTDQIVDFYVQKLANTSGVGGKDYDASVNGGRPYAEFRINYEDVEQGADHDMDAIALYILKVNATNQLEVSVQSEYAAGGIVQHMGYVISGTTQDGVYLEVCDLADGKTNAGSYDNCQAKIAYRLNTPPGKQPGYCNTSSMPSDCTGLPPTASRTFTPGTTEGAGFLNDPLWYAAKYGNDQGILLDGNGDPSNYFLVTNPLYLKEQLTKAFDTIQDQNGDSGSVAFSGTQVSSDSFVVKPSYGSADNGHDWTGDLKAYKVNADGTVGAVLWSAAANMPATSAEVDARKIYTALKAADEDNRSSAVVEFRAENLASTTADMFNRLGYTASDIENKFGGTVTPNQLVNYLRGERSMEGTVMGTAPFRERSSILGDIVNSEPVIAVQSENYGWAYALGLTEAARTGYQSYLTAKSTRKDYVYVGGNDGMLHAFNDEGKEVFAYVPNAVLGRTGWLADPDYAHYFYVDGKLTLADAHVGGSWKTVLVGASGAGGRGVFALDVSDSAAFSSDDVLWEVNGTTAYDGDDIGKDIGYVMGKPLIVPVQNGQWVALFGNGYNSDSGKASLMAVDLASGKVIANIVADDGSDMPDLGYNGMGNIYALDSNGDGLTDTVYGGDLHGNVWKFDLSADDVADWKVAYTGMVEATPNQPKPLFTATDAAGKRQPITGGFALAVGPSGGYVVYFGTGRYFVTGDGDVKDVNTIYGVWDNGSPVTTGRAALQEQTLTSVTDDLSTTADESATRNVSGNVVDYQNVRGWYMDLTVDGQKTGERFTATPTIADGIISFSTSTPGVTDDCTPGVETWNYMLTTLSGTPAFSQNLVSEDLGVSSSTGALKGKDGAPALGEPTVLINYCDGNTCYVTTSYPDGTSVPSEVNVGRYSWRQLK